MKILKLVLLSIIICSLAGCVTSSKMNEVMSSWMGHNVNDLIASWGPPSTVLSDGNGGQILAYDQSRQFVTQGSSSTTVNYIGNMAFANTTSSPGSVINIRRSRIFWVDSNGLIYRWSWRGL